MIAFTIGLRLLAQRASLLRRVCTRGRTVLGRGAGLTGSPSTLSVPKVLVLRNRPQPPHFARSSVHASHSLRIVESAQDPRVGWIDTYQH